MVHRALSGLVLACVLLLAPAEQVAARDGDGTVVQGAWGAKIDAAIQRATAGGFWGAVLVAKDGEVLLAKGYGSADYGSTPNTPLTLFEIASTSKPFTAAAILKLEELGKLKRSDSLAKFFQRIPKDKRNITVQHLLNHTTGLAKELGVPYDSPLKRNAYVKQILKAPRTHEPGTHFSYSNVGYALLAAIVEVASKTDFEPWCAKHLFKPAGMKDTGFIQDKRLLAMKRAAARRGQGKPGISAVDWHYGWGYRGMGGVVTTVHDMLAWDRALRTDKVLGEKARKAYYEPALESYACGWHVGTSPSGGTSVSHSGGVQGFRCMYTRHLQDDVVIAVCTNDVGNPQQIAQIAQGYALPPPLVEATIDATPYTLSKSRGAEWKTGLGWAVAATKTHVAIQLLDPKKRTIATIRVPHGFATGVVKQLERAIQARLKDDPGKSAAVEGGVYFSAYPEGTQKLALNEQLRVVVMPDYNGRDKRVTFVLQDAKHSMWPILVKMNVAGARELLELLRAAR